MTADSSVVTYDEFRAAFNRGASCPELFGLRNRMHPKDPLKPQANEDLRSIGCNTSQSSRS